MDRLKHVVTDSCDENNLICIDELNKIRNDLKALSKEKIQGIITRSRTRWFAEGENNSA